MNKYDVRGEARFGVCSVLSNVRQRVSVDITVSGALTVNCGVPLGSVLGPKLFISYLNDVKSILLFCE